MDLHLLKEFDNLSINNFEEPDSDGNIFRVSVIPQHKKHSITLPNTNLYFRKKVMLSFNENGIAYKNKRIKSGLFRKLFISKSEKEFIKAFNSLIKGHKDEALTRLRNLIKKTPECLDALFTLSLLTDNQQEREGAISYIVDNPDKLGHYFTNYNISLEAKIALTPDIILSICNDKAGLFLFSSEFFYSTGSLEKSINILENSNLLDLAVIRLYLGNLYYEKKDHEKAIRFLQAEITDEPAATIRLLILGKALRELKLYKSAIDTFRKARRRTVDKPLSLILEGRYQLGLTFAELKKQYLACKEFEKILAINYDYKDVNERIKSISR